MKYFISLILITTLLTPSFALAEDFSRNNGYLIDQAGLFSDNILDEKDVVQDLKECNQNPRLSLKILILDSFGNKSVKNYCNDLLKDAKKNQIVLIYNNNTEQIKYCCSDKNSTGITEEEFNYIINEIIQPNIDGGHLTFALRMGIREISVASREDIAPKNYKPNAEVEKMERNKEIIIFLFVIIFFSWLAAYLGKTKSWWLGGVMGFCFGFFIWWISRIWFFMPILSIFGFVYDFFVSRHYKEYRSCEKGAFWCTIGELKRRNKKKKIKK